MTNNVAVLQRDFNILRDLLELYRGGAAAIARENPDLMKRIAATMVGGLVTSFALELLVYPAVYLLWKERELAPGGAGAVR